MFQQYKKIHFVGVGGIGVSALAKWALLDGVKVSGSDVAESETITELKKMGAVIFIGHNKKNVSKGVELIIFSDAVSTDNPERQNNILQKSYFEVLGEVSRKKKTIAISGTNGKSTTTAMLGKIMIDAGLDPTVIVGSKMKDFKYGNLHLGKSEYFVVEACEHNAHMLHLSPEYIVLTNIEADHLDFYKNLKNILTAFGRYVHGAPSFGFVVFNVNDKNTQSIIKKAGGQKISYGTDESADFVIKNRRACAGKQIFDVYFKKGKLGKAELAVPGLFNAENALAAISAAMSLGVSADKIFKSLANFCGIWRRFQVVGNYRGAVVISDYGHHPQAIEATLLATREFYPERRIILAFEPHQHHRTQALFADFVRSFDNADIVILSEIYNVAGRVSKNDKNISSQKLAEAIEKYWETSEEKIKGRAVYYCENLSKTEEKLAGTVKKNDVVILMGAGNIYKLADSLVKLKSR